MPRFNEAPIHESGKFPPARPTKGNSTSFNEAPIHESGKWWSGSARTRRALGFNEAPIHESGKCVATVRARHHERDASMRPRFMNRGSGPS